MNFPGKNTGGGSHSLLQGLFPTQGSNLGLLHCRQILGHIKFKKKKKVDFLILRRNRSQQVGNGKLPEGLRTKELFELSQAGGEQYCV